MVHHRVNEREANPNPHVNFITALPDFSDESRESARQLLRALAAQLRPVMKAHGLEVNSLEEYEYNKVFAGRNWNNGEVIELVLRRHNGSFVPTSYLISTLCHELAHNLHMNHGPAFQRLWSDFRHEVRELQTNGYYGDGYWSSGQRLIDSARIDGANAEADDLPMYMCGGAQARPRTTQRRGGRRRRTRPSGPSHHTGAQTAKRRKAGARVKGSTAFVGKGHALDSSGEGSGFGKRAGSKRAREERAIATEKRIQALLSHGSSSRTHETRDEDCYSDDSDSEGHISESDQDRQLAMNEGDLDAGNKNTSWGDFESEFEIPQPKTPCSGGGGGGATSDRVNGRSDGKAGLKPAEASEPRHVSCSSKHDPAATKVRFGKLVQSEIELRKKESLGLALTGGGKKLVGTSNPGRKWACTACTFLNEPPHLACDVCGTPRDQTSLTEFRH